MKLPLSHSAFQKFCPGIIRIMMVKQKGADIPVNMLSFTEWPLDLKTKCIGYFNQIFHFESFSKAFEVKTEINITQKLNFTLTRPKSRSHDPGLSFVWLLNTHAHTHTPMLWLSTVPLSAKHSVCVIMLQMPRSCCAKESAFLQAHTKTSTVFIAASQFSRLRD